MYGLDISNYQKGIDLSKGKYDFCIVKATEGYGFTDKSFSGYVEQLTKLGKLIGCYHFARPDLNGTINGMEMEAKYFCNVVTQAGLKGKAVLVLDWETEPLNRPDLMEAWFNTVYDTMGVVPFIYGSRSKLTNWKDYDAFKSASIWMSIWPNTKRYMCGENPNLTEPAAQFAWDIWQYTSVGKYPGFNGNVDLDYCKLSREEWLSMAGYKSEVLNDDMKWAIEVGLYKGYGDGTYGPKEPLTREQAAALFRRYTNIFGLEVKK